MVLVIYRMGVQVPTPGVDREGLMDFFANQGGGVLNMLNTFTGGALERFSIFALGILPYITASIIFQLLQTGVPYLEQLKKKGRQDAEKSINTPVIPLFYFLSCKVTAFLKCSLT